MKEAKKLILVVDCDYKDVFLQSETALLPNCFLQVEESFKVVSL